jgi:hypothetical protein
VVKLVLTVIPLAQVVDTQTVPATLKKFLMQFYQCQTIQSKKLLSSVWQMKKMLVAIFSIPSTLAQLNLYRSKHLRLTKHNGYQSFSGF